MQREEELGLNKGTTNATDRNFLSETILNILLPITVLYMGTLVHKRSKPRIFVEVEFLCSF